MPPLNYGCLSCDPASYGFFSLPTGYKFPFRLCCGLTIFRCRSSPPLSVDVAERRPQPHHRLLKGRQQTRLSGGPGNSHQPAAAAPVAAATTATAAEAQADELAGDGGAEPAVDVSLAHFRFPLSL